MNKHHLRIGESGELSPDADRSSPNASSIGAREASVRGQAEGLLGESRQELRVDASKMPGDVRDWLQAQGISLDATSMVSVVVTTPLGRQQREQVTSPEPKHAVSVAEGVPPAFNVFTDFVQNLQNRVAQRPGLRHLATALAPLVDDIQELTSASENSSYLARVLYIDTCDVSAKILLMDGPEAPEFNYGTTYKREINETVDQLVAFQIGLLTMMKERFGLQTAKTGIYKDNTVFDYKDGAQNESPSKRLYVIIRPSLVQGAKEVTGPKVICCPDTAVWRTWAADRYFDDQIIRP